MKKKMKTCRLFFDTVQPESELKWSSNWTSLSKNSLEGGSQFSSFEIPKKSLKPSMKPVPTICKVSINKKTSKCRGIIRMDKINFARWRWGPQVLSKDGSVIAIEDEENHVPVLRSVSCEKEMEIRNTGRPSTMCRKCYEVNRTLQYGLRDMKRGKLGKKKFKFCEC